MFKYWFYYSSEEFAARVVKARVDWHPADDGDPLSGHYHGPFNTLKEARREIMSLINGDINEFRQMAATVKGPPEEV